MAESHNNLAQAVRQKFLFKNREWAREGAQGSVEFR